MSGGPITILTALNVEYAAMRERLTEVRLHQHRAGTRFEIGRLTGSRCRVALALVGKGNHPAAVLAERAIAEFSPTALLFVGVAGALWPSIALGDVIVATHVYAYHGGTSEDDGLSARPRVWEISHGPDQVARHLARTNDWRRFLPHVDTPMKVHFGPLAAGEIVQNSSISGHARWIRQHYNDALAIEMEAAGVAQAAHLNGSPVVIVRGISDLANGTKMTTDEANWQPRAAVNAAAFAAALSVELDRSAIDHQSISAPPTTRSATMNQANRNIATGNSRVGVQAHTVHGNISINHEPEAPASLAERIAQFKDQIRQARINGQLDDTTYTAVEEDLAVVTESLASGTTRSRETLVIALKRLRGLVGDVADLASKLAIIISLAAGMS